MRLKQTKRIFFRRVVGQSMLPTLVPGKIVVFRAKQKFKIGDIVVAKINGIEVVKRVHKVNLDSYDLVGDNKVDSKNYNKVSASDIAGKLILYR